MKNKLVLFLLLGVVTGVHASSSSFDEYDSDDYSTDGVEKHAALESPTKYKKGRVLRREDSERSSFNATDPELSLIRKNSKNKSLRHKDARQDKQKKK